MIERRSLGRTGLTVSALGLGTAALGADYGIAAPGAFGRPSTRAAAAVVRAAADAGVAFVDTAPAYGNAERVVGLALRGRDDVVVATKLAAGAAPRASVEASARALGRDPIDVVQEHNATAAALSGVLGEQLRELRDAGLARAVGATVYGEDAALAAIDAGLDVVQVAYNLLDRRMADRVFPAAAAAGCAVVVRSAFLKGALTARAPWLPDELAPLRDAAEGARVAAGGTWTALAAAALRWCLAAPVACVLAGPRTTGELDEALAAAAAGPLDGTEHARLAAVAPLQETLVDPRLWAVA